MEHIEDLVGLDPPARLAALTTAADRVFFYTMFKAHSEFGDIKDTCERIIAAMESAGEEDAAALRRLDIASKLLAQFEVGSKATLAEIFVKCDFVLTWEERCVLWVSLENGYDLSVNEYNRKMVGAVMDAALKLIPAKSGRI